jgi:phosphoenolpyruvate carboxykinase (ATP)
MTTYRSGNLKNTGHFNPAFPIETTGIEGAGEVHYNLNAAQLFEMSVKLGEGMVTDSGNLAVTTGKHTGRSAQDKFIVRDASTENNIWWDNNKAMTPNHFGALKADFLDHAKGRRLFVQDLYGGADPEHRIKVRVVTQFAWHALFIRYLLRRPSHGEVMSFTPELTIINQPSFKADPGRHGCRTETVIAVNLTDKLVLIGDSEYAGETKKSVFGTLNYFLPEKGVMPMHCSANAGSDGTSALFFGLSGTGKTTLSSTPRARWWATTNTAGRPTASSISRAAATPRRSSCRRRQSLKSIRPRNGSVQSSKTSWWIRRPAFPTLTMAR